MIITGFAIQIGAPFITVFQNHEKEKLSKTVFEVEDETAMREEFDNLKKDHSSRFFLFYAY